MTIDKREVATNQDQKINLMLKVIAIGLVAFLATGSGALAALEIISGSLRAERMLRGVGAPENVVSAPVGCIYQRSDGAEHTVTYIKVTGTGNTGWVANEE